MNESHSEEVISQLEKMNSDAGALIRPCKYKSSFELYGDLRSRAKREQHLYFYALGTFYQMDQAQYLLDFQTMRERAIELISLLESEEQSRKIQPDVPLPIFDHLVYSMSACAYENLAEATGQLDGYNSEGLQACISDGIQICRQTGKLPCVGCFREYSCDVYMAADDAEIAKHQCSLVLDQTLPPSDRGDRRWLAKKKVAWMSCLEGQIDDAISLIRESLELTNEEGVSLQLESKLKAMLDLDTFLILSGKPPELESAPIFQDHPDRGECPFFDLMGDLNRALVATMKEDWKTATELLMSWDRKLSEQNANHLWFETRLRLVAIKQLAGEEKQAERLAKQLEKKANESTDWLTLRRLAAITDPDFPTSPIGVFGHAKQKSVSAAQSATEPTELKEADAETPEEKQRGGPLREDIEAIGEEMMAIEPETAEQSMSEIRAKIMSYTVEQIQHPDDASALMHLMGYVAGDCGQAEEIWSWANKVSSNYQEDGTVLSLLAHLGNRLRFGDNREFAETISAERLEPLFKKSLQLDNTRPRSFMRAGDHYLAEENHGEAERCYARSFRLARSEGEIALRLASLYRDTDRPRDALHVLDVCLREGTDHPLVPWEAALSAFAIGRYEAMLTYLDRFENESGDRPWLNYYRAIGYLEQGKAAEALAAIAKEEEVIEERAFHTVSVSGCANAKVGNLDAARADMQKTLDTALMEADYLNPSGIADALRRCLKAANEIGDKGISNAFMQRLLESGLSDEDMFEPLRTEDAKEVKLFRCLVEQPLDESWKDFKGCLFGQEDWEIYLAEWGVLATDEADAEEIVLEWQGKCYNIEPSMGQILPSDQVYTDSPGIVWQGGRFSPTDLGAEDSEDHDDLDEHDE